MFLDTLFMLFALMGNVAQSEQAAPVARVSLLDHVLTFAGALAVAIIAFLVSQRLTARESREAVRVEYCSLLKVVAEEVLRNLELECQIHAYIYAGLSPTFRMSLVAPGTVFRRLSAIHEDSSLLRLIFREYYEFQHIDDRLSYARDAREIVAQTVRQTMSGEVAQRHQAARVEYDSKRGGVAKLANSHTVRAWRLYNELVRELELHQQAEGFDRLPDDYLLKRHEAWQNDPDTVSAVQSSETRQRHFADRPKHPDIGSVSGDCSLAAGGRGVEPN